MIKIISSQVLCEQLKKKNIPNNIFRQLQSDSFELTSHNSDSITTPINTYNLSFYGKAKTTDSSGTTKSLLSDKENTFYKTRMTTKTKNLDVESCNVLLSLINEFNLDNDEVKGKLINTLQRKAINLQNTTNMDSVKFQECKNDALQKLLQVDPNVSINEIVKGQKSSNNFLSAQDTITIFRECIDKKFGTGFSNVIIDNNVKYDDAYNVLNIDEIKLLIKCGIQDVERFKERREKEYINPFNPSETTQTSLLETVYGLYLEEKDMPEFIRRARRFEGFLVDEEQKVKTALASVIFDFNDAQTVKLLNLTQSGVSTTRMPLTTEEAALCIVNGLSDEQLKNFSTKKDSYPDLSIDEIIYCIVYDLNDKQIREYTNIRKKSKFDMSNKTIRRSGGIQKQPVCLALQKAKNGKSNFSLDVEQRAQYLFGKGVGVVNAYEIASDKRYVDAFDRTSVAATTLAEIAHAKISFVDLLSLFRLNSLRENKLDFRLDELPKVSVFDILSSDIKTPKQAKCYQKLVRGIPLNEVSYVCAGGISPSLALKLAQNEETYTNYERLMKEISLTPKDYAAKIKSRDLCKDDYQVYESTVICDNTSPFWALVLIKSIDSDKFFELLDLLNKSFAIEEIIKFTLFDFSEEQINRLAEKFPEILESGNLELDDYIAETYIEKLNSTDKEKYHKLVDCNLSPIEAAFIVNRQIQLPQNIDENSAKKLLYEVFGPLDSSEEIDFQKNISALNKIDYKNISNEMVAFCAYLNRGVDGLVNLSKIYQCGQDDIYELLKYSNGITNIIDNIDDFNRYMDSIDIGGEYIQEYCSLLDKIVFYDSKLSSKEIISYSSIPRDFSDKRDIVKILRNPDLAKRFQDLKCKNPKIDKIILGKMLLSNYTDEQVAEYETFFKRIMGENKYTLSDKVLDNFVKICADKKLMDRFEKLMAKYENWSLSTEALSEMIVRNYSDNEIERVRKESLEKSLFPDLAMNIIGNRAYELLDEINKEKNRCTKNLSVLGSHLGLEVSSESEFEERYQKFLQSEVKRSPSAIAKMAEEESLAPINAYFNDDECNISNEEEQKSFDYLKRVIPKESVAKKIAIDIVQKHKRTNSEDTLDIKKLIKQVKQNGVNFVESDDSYFLALVYIDPSDVKTWNRFSQISSYSRRLAIMSHPKLRELISKDKYSVDEIVKFSQVGLSTDEQLKRYDELVAVRMIDSHKAALIALDQKYVEQLDEKVKLTPEQAAYAASRPEIDSISPELFDSFSDDVWYGIGTGEAKEVHEIFNQAIDEVNKSEEDFFPIDSALFNELYLPCKGKSKVKYSSDSDYSCSMNNGVFSFKDNKNNNGFDIKIRKVNVQNKSVLYIENTDPRDKHVYIAYNGAITQIEKGTTRRNPSINMQELENSFKTHTSIYPEKQNKILASAATDFVLDILDSSKTKTIIGEGIPAYQIEPYYTRTKTEAQIKKHYEKIFDKLKSENALTVENVLRIMPKDATLQINPYITNDTSANMLYSISSEWYSKENKEFQLRVHSTDFNYNGGDADWVVRLACDDNYFQFVSGKEWSGVHKGLNSESSHIKISKNPFDEHSLLRNIHFQTIINQISGNHHSKVTLKEIGSSLRIPNCSSLKEANIKEAIIKKVSTDILQYSKFKKDVDKFRIQDGLLPLTQRMFA